MRATTYFSESDAANDHLDYVAEGGVDESANRLTRPQRDLLGRKRELCGQRDDGQRRAYEGQGI